MNMISRVMATITICAVLGGTTTGCNMMQGLGKDMEKGGKEVQDAAEEAKD